MLRNKPPGIYGFFREHGYLSNFYVEPDGTHVEGEYQRAKCKYAHLRDKFEGLRPAEARRLGRSITVRDDWDDVKLEIMLFYVTKKFNDHPTLAAKLKATGSLYLEESNEWGDQYWGVSNGRGQNMLGAVLMEVRNALLVDSTTA